MKIARRREEARPYGIGGSMPVGASVILDIGLPTICVKIMAAVVVVLVMVTVVVVITKG